MLEPCGGFWIFFVFVERQWMEDETRKFQELGNRRNFWECWRGKVGRIWDIGWYDCTIWSNPKFTLSFLIRNLFMASFVQKGLDIIQQRLSFIKSAIVLTIACLIVSETFLSCNILLKNNYLFLFKTCPVCLSVWTHVYGIRRVVS